MEKEIPPIVIKTIGVSMLITGFAIVFFGALLVSGKAFYNQASAPPVK